MAHQLSIPDFIEPAFPDLRPVLAIHRGHDGFVSFHSGDGEFHDLFSIRACDLEGVFPQLIPQLEFDGYFSINGFLRHGGYLRGNRLPELSRALRRNDSVRWLTCCFADLDSHRLGLSVGQTVGAVIDAQDRNEIPPASMMVRSGRGVWCFWFLMSDDGSGLVGAFPDKVQTWCSIQNSIGKRLAILGSDPMARDLSRITRIAGSVNSKAAAGRVSYWIQKNGAGGKYTYTLGDLAERFGVKRPKVIASIESKNEELAARGRKGAAARWMYDLDRFRRLWNLRGTFPVGMRNKAVNIYATILASLRGDDAIPPADIRAAVLDLWETFPQEPEPYPWSQALRVLSPSSIKGLTAKSKLRPLRAQSIADLLEVTQEEFEILKNGGKGWPPAMKYGGAVRETLSRPEQQKRRRELLRGRFGGGAAVPPLGQLVVWLDETAGLESTPATVASDLRAIGIENPRGHVAKSRRKRSRAQKRERKLFCN